MPVTGKEAALLEPAWAAVGGDPRQLNGLEVVADGAGLWPSSLEALPAMVAAVAASTLAASVLDGARRDAAAAPVLVDRAHVAVAGHSERHARTDGPTRDVFAPLSRFWRTADGWLRLHANYDWHRQRVLYVLGIDDGRPAAVAEAVRQWPGTELEEALAGAGALGYVVRTREQWATHPQGQAVAALPLAQSWPLPGSGRRWAAGRGATGVRVLDLSRVIAGPVATRTLAAWGAQVLRLDSPRLPELPGHAVDGLSGKRSAALDLAEPQARAGLEELLAAADVLVQGYRPGTMARFGLDPRELADRHPQLPA